MIYKDKEKHELVDKRFKAFVKNLCIEVGDSAVGAMFIIEWQKDVSFGAVTGDAPPAVQSNILDTMAKKMAMAVRQIKERLGMSTQ